jgi:hypothetical protein
MVIFCEGVQASELLPLYPRVTSGICGTMLVSRQGSESTHRAVDREVMHAGSVPDSKATELVRSFIARYRLAAVHQTSAF